VPGLSRVETMKGIQGLPPKQRAALQPLML
jgi:hypothetical protein